MGLSTLPNEAAVRAALAAQLGAADGLYFFPDMRDGPTPSPGPWGLLLYHPQLSFSWAVMGWEALTELVMGVALALLVGMAAPELRPRMAIASWSAIAAAFAVSPSDTIWFGFPIAYTLGQMIVAFGDYLVGGAVIAWLLKPKAAAAGA